MRDSKLDHEGGFMFDPWLKICLPLLALGVVLAGCPGNDDDAADFEAGMFVFTTLAVDDGCLGGAAEALYMPDGPETPVEWVDAIEVPAFAELPKTYTISLPDPYHDMEIEVTSPGEDQFAFDGAENLDVLLDEETYDDCMVDNDISAVITVEDNDNLSGSATLSTTNVRGDSCPEFDADPCDIVLDISAARQ